MLVVTIDKQFTLSENVELVIKTDHDYILTIHGITFNLEVDEVHGLDTILEDVKWQLESTLFSRGSEDIFGYYDDIHSVPKNVDEIRTNNDDENDDYDDEVEDEYEDEDEDEEMEILFQEERIKALKTLESYLNILEIQFLYPDWEDNIPLTDKLLTDKLHAH